MRETRVIVWQALEHEHGERSADWYWTVGAISISLVILTAYFGNYLLATVVALASFASILHAQRGPDMIRYEIGPRGIVVNDTLYTYANLASFWIDHLAYRSRIVVKPKKPLAPLLVMPLTDLDEDAVREYLEQYLDEVEHTESMAKKLLERIGF